MKRLASLAMALLILLSTSICAFATSDSNTRTINSNPRKRIQANVWIDTWATSSGNSNRWEYTVSAKFLDSKNYVEWIKTEWYAYAIIRKSTVITLGIQGKTTKELTVSATASSEWQTKYTSKAHYTNGKYYTISDWANTLVINSRSDYKAGSKGVTNTAYVKVFGDPKTYSVAATT
ncbi:MAG: hypothetical protein SPF51_06565 [Candidatus Fimivicinus sp.]|nr:hypothetical protein [Oscillospiraceae bacterium]MDY5591196.1 hypothetical protein [Candidatus Fimivicinus sp.]